MSEKDIFPCSKCKTPTHIDLLDAKDDGTGNYTILECQKCYGPGWSPVGVGEEQATPEEIARAREMYGSTEIEIDEDAAASRGEGGVWVAAWVWLPEEGGEANAKKII